MNTLRICIAVTSFEMPEFRVAIVLLCSMLTVHPLIFTSFPFLPTNSVVLPVINAPYELRTVSKLLMWFSFSN